MRHLAASALILAVLAGTSAFGQERAPSSRQTLIDLAYVLGEAHALRQACRPGDQQWRGRMQALLDTENPEFGFAERLRGQFNTGYVARQAQFPACSAESRRAEAAVGDRGAALARRMGSARSADSVAPR